MKTLRILPPNTTHTFKSSIHPRLVRTGVIGDGGCLFHSICYALYSYYRKMSEDEQRKFVSIIRKNIAESVDEDVWMSLGQGEIFKLCIIMILREMLENQSIRYTFEEWDNRIFPEISTKWSSNRVEDLEELLTSYLVLRSEHTIMKQYIGDARKRGLKEFKHHLVENWGDEFYLEIVSKFFKTSIVFIDSTTREVYNTFNPHEYDTFVLVCWIDGCHYESMGILGDDKVVTRIFQRDDDIIQRVLE